MSNRPSNRQSNRQSTTVNMIYGLRRFLRKDQTLLGILALITGLSVGIMVVGFREGILFFHGLFFGAADERLFLSVLELPWWQILLVPTLGGLVIGLLIHKTLKEARPEGVADVIESFTLRNGRMPFWSGLRAAFINMLSIGVGASVGREGPAVHLGAVLASGISQRLRLAPPLARTLLACGVAAAVSASFNAPIAGALFAGEVVIGHYALKAFAPVVLSSVAGTIMSRAYYGDFPAFTLPAHGTISYLEYPTFILLGVLAGFCATFLLQGIFKTQKLSQKLPLPAWAHPALGGLALGLIALVLPQVLGVGYGATEMALNGQMALWLLLAVLAGKMLAVMISLGLGFGGGIFSPSLMIGAMLGGAYGILMISIFPSLDAGSGGYTLVGMGAVAAATLGAPISTALIIFEMTGDYQLTLGVLLAVVTSTAVTRQIIGRDFFTLQLAGRGLDLKGGFEAQVLRALKIADVMEAEPQTIAPTTRLSEVRIRIQKSKAAKLFVVEPDGTLLGTIRLAELGDMAFNDKDDGDKTAADIVRRRPPLVKKDDDLQTAIRKMTDSGESQLAVVKDMKSFQFVGTVEQMHVLAAYNRALLASRHEEHDQ